MARTIVCEQGSCHNEHESGDGKGITLTWGKHVYTNHTTQERKWFCSWVCVKLHAEKEHARVVGS